MLVLDLVRFGLRENRMRDTQTPAAVDEWRGFFRRQRWSERDPISLLTGLATAAGEDACCACEQTERGRVLAGADCDVQEGEDVLHRVKSMPKNIVTCRCEELPRDGPASLPLSSHSFANYAMRPRV